jgi:hypothetical protein
VALGDEFSQQLQQPLNIDRVKTGCWLVAHKQHAILAPFAQLRAGQ